MESALIAGIKFPTGETNEKHSSGEKFEAELQPGSGSWDAEFGFALSRRFKKGLSLATSFQYFLKTQGAQEHEGGDVFRYNWGASWTLRESGKYPNLSATLEFNHEWALKDRSRTESRVFDSGGTAVFVSPGLVVHFARHFSAFWTIPIPIYQNLGGEHEELKFETLAGATLHFN